MFLERGLGTRIDIGEKKKIQKMLDHKKKGAELTFRSGPVASSVDPTLTKHRTTPQTYHNRSFVSNHYHKRPVHEVKTSMKNSQL